MVGVFDDDGVGGGNVDFGFDDGGVYQYIEVLVMEVIYYLFQFVFFYLIVIDGDLCFWYQFCQFVGGFLDVFNVIKQIVDLVVVQCFVQDCFVYYQGVIFVNEGFYCQVVCWWCGDD